MKPLAFKSKWIAIVISGLFCSMGWARGLTPELRQDLRSFYQKKTGVLHCKAIGSESREFSVHPLPDGFAVSVTDHDHGFLAMRAPERDARFEERNDGEALVFRLESRSQARRLGVSLEIRATPDNEDWSNTTTEFPIPGSLLSADDGRSLITALHSICQLK